MESNTEQKKLIFDFMGGIHSKNKDIDRWEMELLKYDTDWNQLMPVIEKISKMPLLNTDGTPCEFYSDTCYPVTFNMPSEDGNVMFRFKGFSLHVADKLIDAAYNAVIEVVEYHNQQSK